MAVCVFESYPSQNPLCLMQISGTGLNLRNQIHRGWASLVDSDAQEEYRDGCKS